MPELPDISAYIVALEARILGKTLERVRIASVFVLRTVDPPIAAVEGRTVRGLRRIGKRIEENHRAKFIADQSAIDHIVSLCHDPDSGGRVIDNIITNTILPALSREILKRSLAREKIHEAKVSATGGAFVYEVN